jgi:hypothetical protein
MTADRTMVSARAEKRRGLARRGVRKIFTVSLAAVLTLPSLAAWGMEVQNGKAQPSRFETITLPPIPSLETVPWLDWKTGMKVDTLLSPILDPSGIKLEPAGHDQVNSAVS